MVAKIPPPQDNSIQVLNLTLGERVKFRRFYDKIRPALIQQYERYEEFGGCPTRITPLNIRNYTDSNEEAESRKTSLIGLYSPAENKLPFEQLEKIRKKNGLVSCPICGEAGRPRTLDHYLPKTAFPELAINLLNLVPACDWCQGEKLAEYLNPDGSRRYIHSYFDEVNTPLFNIIFDPPYDSPRISIGISDQLEPEMQKLVASHLDGIGFLKRFIDIFETSYQSVVRMAKRSREPGNISLDQSLNEALGVARDKGVNCWDAVLYRSVLADPLLLEFLEMHDLPEFI